MSLDLRPSLHVQYMVQLRSPWHPRHSLLAALVVPAALAVPAVRDACMPVERLEFLPHQCLVFCLPGYEVSPYKNNSFSPSV